MNDLIKLAVIILNYNCATFTIKCVEQLRSFEANFHIVVVDNNSTDNSFMILKKRYEGTGVSILNSGFNGGYSAGNNYGIQYAIREYGIKYFAIVNPDVIIPSVEVFEKLMDTMEADEKCAVIGASVINPVNIYVPAFSAWKIQEKKEFILSRSLFVKNPFVGIMKWKLHSEKVAEVDCVAGCFFIASVKILEEIGFLDEEIFMYNEEMLLGYRVKELGYHELLQLDQFYYHNHKKKASPTLKNYISKRKKRFQSDVILYKKIYQGKWGLIFMYLLEWVNRIVLFPWFALKLLLQGRNVDENT